MRACFLKDSNKCCHFLLQLYVVNISALLLKDTVGGIIQFKLWQPLEVYE